MAKTKFEGLKSAVWKAKDEDSLTDYIENVRYINDILLVAKYWYIGRAILNFFNNKIVEDKIRLLHFQRDIDKQNIVDACRFAQKYTEDQLDQIINSDFTLYWFQLVRNLDMSSDLLVKEVLYSFDQEGFDLNIQEIRDAKAEAISGPETIITSEKVKENIAVTNDTAPVLSELTEVDLLKAKVMELEKNLQNKDIIIDRFNKQLDKMLFEIEDQDDTISKWKLHMKYIIDMVEDNIDRTKIIDYWIYISYYGDCFNAIN
jgi:hypothetical protein